MKTTFWINLKKLQTGGAQTHLIKRVTTWLQAGRLLWAHTLWLVSAVSLSTICKQDRLLSETFLLLDRLSVLLLKRSDTDNNVNCLSNKQGPITSKRANWRISKTGQHIPVVTQSRIKRTLQVLLHPTHPTKSPTPTDRCQFDYN